MQYNTACLELRVPLSDDGYVFDVNSLYDHLLRLSDKRKARGKRYSVALVVVLMVLAKLSGEDQPSGIAQWARARQALLCRLLQMPRPSLPSHNTYRRVLGAAVEVAELQAAFREFLQRWPGAGTSVLVAIDGKTLRGSLAPGQTRGLHLLAAYLPEEGLVLMQVAVGQRENEIPVAPRVLESLDLQGKIVRGDALHTQRQVSVQIVEAGGEYLWLAKDNQPSLHQAIEQVFQPEACVKGFSPTPKDFRTAETIDKAPGRLEHRTLTTSDALQGCSDWPYLAQVFKLERRRLQLKTGVIQHEVAYGLTSLSRAEAGPARLLDLARDYWGIENGLHYRRDKTLREDATRMSNPQLAEAVALLNNLVIGLAVRQGWQYLPQARRHYSACLDEALNLVLRRPA